MLAPRSVCWRLAVLTAAVAGLFLVPAAAQTTGRMTSASGAAPASRPVPANGRADTATGLMGWWRFDEGVGTSTADATGRGHTGALINGPEWVAGRSGKALSFDGKTTYVVIPSSTDFDSSNEFSISAWVYPTDPALRMTIAARCMESYWHLWMLEQIPVPGGTAIPSLEYMTRVKAGDQALRARGNAYTMNAWHHVVATKTKDGVVHIYTDGVKGTDSIVNPNPDPNLSGQKITIGARRSRTGDAVWKGYIDEVRFYDRALSESDVTELFNAKPQDWPQWRGPHQNGIADGNEELLGSWPASGPKLLWKSPMIPGAVEGGYGSVTVAGDRCYLYVNWKTHDPITTRRLSTDALNRLGWSTLKMPEDLVKAMEEARTSPERAGLKPPEVRPWAGKWAAEHVTGDQKAALLSVVTDRLIRGPAAIPLDVLDKLAHIKDKEFESQAALDKWFRDNGMEDKLKAEILREVSTTATRATDTILSLDRADGNIVWKRQYPGLVKQYGTSSTPCVTGGRLYVAGAETIYCLKADDGSEVWKVPADCNDASSASPVLVDGKAMRVWGLSSSPMVVDGVVAILAWELVGLDCRDGKRLWSQPKLRGNNASPVLWRKDGKPYLLCNTGTNTAACVEPATGKILWEVPGGGGGTVALGEDAFVIYSERNQTGVVAYTLSVEKPQRLWARPSTGLERGTTPVIQGGYVYAVGGNKVFCLSMADGSTAWKRKYVCEMSSPVLASGKVFAMVEKGNHVLMIKATGEKFELLGDAKIQTVRCSSPVVADGRLYLRLHDGVACYDLRK